MPQSQLPTVQRSRSKRILRGQPSVRCQLRTRAADPSTERATIYAAINRFAFNRVAIPSEPRRFQPSSLHRPLPTIVLRRQCSAPHAALLVPDRLLRSQSRLARMTIALAHGKKSAMSILFHLQRKRSRTFSTPARAQRVSRSLPGAPPTPRAPIVSFPSLTITPPCARSRFGIFAIEVETG